MLKIYNGELNDTNNYIIKKIKFINENRINKTTLLQIDNIKGFINVFLFPWKTV